MTPAVDMPDVCDCHGVPTRLVDVPGGWRRVCAVDAEAREQLTDELRRLVPFDDQEPDS